MTRGNEEQGTWNACYKAVGRLLTKPLPPEAIAGTDHDPKLLRCLKEGWELGITAALDAIAEVGSEIRHVQDDSLPSDRRVRGA